MKLLLRFSINNRKSSKRQANFTDGVCFFFTHKKRGEDRQSLGMLRVSHTDSSCVTFTRSDIKVSNLKQARLPATDTQSAKEKNCRSQGMQSKFIWVRKEFWNQLLHNVWENHSKSLIFYNIASEASYKCFQHCWERLRTGEICWDLLINTEEHWNMLRFAEICLEMLRFAEKCWDLLRLQNAQNLSSNLSIYQYDAVIFSKTQQFSVRLSDSQ